MKKLILLVIVLVVGISVASVFVSFANNENIAFKSGVFFVSQNEVLPFSCLFSEQVYTSAYAGLTCDDESVATITSTGLFGKSVGTTFVRMQSDLGSPQFKIVVKENLQMFGLDFEFNNSTQISGFVGDEISLFSTSANQIAFYTTVNNKVDFCTSSGIITLLQVGTSTLTLTFQTPLFTFENKTVLIECYDKVFAQSLETQSSVLLKLNGNSFNLNPTVFPQTCNMPTTYTSTNTQVATVDSSGLISPCGVGSANIIARVQSGSQTFIESTTIVNVESALTFAAVETTDLNNFPKSSWVVEDNQSTIDLKVAVTTDFASNNASIELTSNAFFTETLSRTITNNQTIFHICADVSDNIYFQAIAIQNFANSSAVIMQSELAEIAIEMPVEAFSVAFTSAYSMQPLQLQNGAYTLFYEANLLVELPFGVTTPQISKNFARQLTITPLNSLIIMNGNVLQAQGVGQAEIIISDALGKVEQQVFIFNILPIFSQPISDDTICVETYNNLAFPTINFDLPAFTNDFSATANLQSKNGLFEMSNNSLLSLETGTDYLCVFVNEFCIKEIRVEIERHSNELQVWNVIEDCNITPSNNQVVLNRANCIELLWTVSIFSTDQQPYYFEVLIMNTDNSQTSYSQHGILFSGSSPKEYNRISMIATIPTTFIIRVFVMGLPQIYLDVIVTII